MQPALATLLDNVGKVFVGHAEVVRLAVATLLARGHLLIEDAPGTGKTLLARSLAQSLGARFRRIQFTPDLLPSDITGVSVFNPKEQSFEFIPGPVFTQVLLADEINRTSPRTQSSLLETMEEHQVTVDGETLRLPEPFFVLATQNPVELGGTYPLPEAQIDRFLMRLRLGYPEAEDEVRILEIHRDGEPVDDLGPVLETAELLALQSEVRRVAISDELKRYIVDIAAATRTHPDVTLGVSPRGSLALMSAAQAYAFLDGYDYVTPDTVKAVTKPVLTHRLILKAQREYTGLSAESVLDDVLRETSVPVLPHDERTAQVHP